MHQKPLVEGCVHSGAVLSPGEFAAALTLQKESVKMCLLTSILLGVLVCNVIGKCNEAVWVLVSSRIQHKTSF